MPAEASAIERSAIDRIVAGTGSARDGQTARVGIAEAKGNRHLLLPALHALQDEIGWISEGGLSYVSERLSVPPAEAYGVATFYALLATEEQPERVAHVCDDIACLALGAEDVIAELSGVPGVHRSPCLGQCERGPAAMIQVAGAANGVIAPAIASSVVNVLEGAVLDAQGPSNPVPPEQAGNPGGLLGRIGVTDPASLDDYVAAGGYRALPMAIEMGREAVIAQVESSSIRGRGGAAFPAGIKWAAVAGATETVRYVVCNADESEPGTFKDRVLLEGDPFVVVEAMTIAGFAVGAQRGFIYIRAEYPFGEALLVNAIRRATAAGHLGRDISANFSFDIEVRRGAGAYICGEETALFNSIEGFRGEPRQKPPFPTEAGLFAKPTLVNNVETLANVPRIVIEGGKTFAASGTTGSTGTKLFSVSGDVGAAGVYEVVFGTSLRSLIELAGGVDGSLGAVLVGGAAGAFVKDDGIDVELTFEGTRGAGLPLGSGSIVVFNDTTDFEAVTARIARFFHEESCGQCVPCRVGTVRQSEALDRLFAASDPAPDLVTLRDLDLVMRDASICGLGQFASTAVQSALALGLIGGAE